MKQQEGFFIVTAEDIGCDPRIPRGARLLCTEKIAPQNGDYVLIRRGDTPPFLRAYFVREDGSILLKAYHKDADSYLANAETLKASGVPVVVRMEYDFPAGARAGLPEEDDAAQVPHSGQELSPSAPPPDASAAPELLTFEEAQEMLKVRRTKMYALLRSGELRASKVGKLWRVERRSIQEYLAAKTYRTPEAR